MKKVINSENAPKAIGPYSQAVSVGEMLFLSGQIPIDPVSNSIPSDIESQTVCVLENIKAILKGTKFTLDDIVKTTVFLTDLSNFSVMNEIYAKFFCAPFPARSTVEVSALPRGVLVEIECIAVRKIIRR
ncbi:MAG: RidA family protein [Christensenellaceae bacterium]|jgi:2-iminobutanoate/2-iminopropanoate deaminase|nr:RidA family protein [Christensenellaceae bacterium]